MITALLRRKRALVVAVVALVAALQGPALAQDAYTAASKAINGSKIKKSSITGKQVRKDSLTGTHIKESTLGKVKRSANADNAAKAANADNAVNAQNATNAQNAAKAAQADKATTADSAATAAEVGWITRYSKSLEPTSGATEDEARLAAPEVELGKAGTLTIYAKCFATATDTYGVVYVKTSKDRAIVNSDNDSFWGGANADDWLNTDSDEDDRELFYESTSDGTDIYGSHTTEWSAFDPDGVTARGEQLIAVKHGDQAAGNGGFGAGNRCVIAGQIERFNS
jgi:hypothetical protein